MMETLSRRVGVVGVACALIAGCSSSDDESGEDATATDATVAGDVPDTATVPDSQLFVDTATTQETSAADGELTDATGSPAGTPCEDGESCASGWCVPSAIGVVCVDQCLSDCPVGHICAPASSEGMTDPVYLCVPIVPHPGADAVGDSGGGDTSVEADGGDTGGGEDVVGPDVTTDEDAVGEDAAADTTSEPDTFGGPDGGIIDDDDDDDDGIPDDEDNIPCMGFFLTVYNEGVTSGSMTLNGIEVIGSNAFPTEEPIIVTLNPVLGENTLDIRGKLTGSPSDSLTLVVQDTTGRLWFFVVIIREPGAPVPQAYTFEIDVECPAEP